MYDARFGTLVPKWTSAPANQFDTAFPFQRVMLPLRPLARITPLFGDPVGRRSKQSFRVVPGSVASLSKSPVVSNVGYSLPPAPSIVVSEFPLFPPILRVRGAGLPPVATRYSIIVHLCRKLVCLSLCLRRV